MDVGVRYCGGCNPRYDRKAAVQALAAALPGLRLLEGDAALHTNILLIVCGCSTRCLTVPPCSAEKSLQLYLLDHADFFSAVDKLSQMMTL